MATEVPRLARLDLPAWFWGGDVEGYFASARLRARRDDQTGVVTVQTEERASHERPKLVRTTELAGPATRIPAPLVGQVEAETLTGLGLSNIVRRDDVDTHLQRLLARTAGPASPGSLAAGLAAHQLQTTAATAADLDGAIQAIIDDIRNIKLAETGQPAFPNASVHFIQRDQALLHRTKLASVLLRLRHDDALRNADIRKLTKANARGEPIFAASGGIGDGVATLDAYLAPLLGAVTPFVWAIPATRASGTVIYALGSRISGTESEAAEPLQLLPSRGPDEVSSAPILSSRSAEATIQWWIRRLDGILGVLSDPAVYTDSNLEYIPSKHLHAQLSIEQLFRRTASIQRAHRDSDARRVLLFTTLDTLERVTSRTLTTMCTLSFARRTLDELRRSLSQDVAQLLLPAAECAVDALASAQKGFFLAQQLGRDVVEFVDTNGVTEQLSFEDAAAEYIRVLRNATHGHGSNRKKTKLKTDALLAHHDGSFHHDLALLGYLYLLDMLSHPENLRRTLWDGGAS